MNEIASTITAYYALKPAQYSVLASLTLSQGLDDAGVCEQSLSLLMQQEFGRSGPCLHLEFHGVRNLMLQQPELSLMSIGHIQISAGSEGPNIQSKYLVRDPEQERVIWFECRDFVSYVE